MAPQRNAGAGAEAELPEYAGHYRLESCLGSGGMGVVHLARSTSGMKLAVKVVHAEFARDREFRGRFRQEIAAARKVSGAFTASVVDADPDAERPWMATLFIPGPTLSDQVKRNGAMAPEQLRRLMAGLAEALRDIHRVGVVHRDLKPSNVLLAEDGPKVIDFGISRPKDSELRTETGKLIGTPPFMAPEQFRRPREVGPAADIFALGSVMVHAATGRGPFDSDSPYVVAYQVVHDEPDLTGVPENLAPLIGRCLAKEPEDRPTPDELMRELRSVAASYDTQAFIPAQRTSPEPKAPRVPAEKPEVRRRLGKFRGRRTALTAAVLALVMGGAFTAVRMAGDEPAPAGNGTGKTSAAFSSWETASVSGSATVPQCSYGASKLLCAQSGVVFALDPLDGRVLWRHAVSGTRVGPPAVTGGLVHPWLDLSRSLKALDPATGKPKWQRDVPPYSGLAYAGGSLLLTGTDGAVSGVDGATGAPRWSHHVPGHELPYFASFPGDPLAYAISRSQDDATTRVTAVEPDTGDVRWDALLDGALKPVGTADGSVYFVALGKVYEDATSVVRYSPDTKNSVRVELPVPVQQPEGTVRGDVVYLLGNGGSLVAVDMDARRQRWSTETGVTRGSAPVTDERHVFFTALDGRLLAMDAQDGSLAGQTPPRLGSKPDQVAVGLPAPVIVGRHIYASAPNGSVFAVDARNPSTW
ncbi:serine/threonine protein kinase [Streptomyces davaonensis JCM 4913]|uniref:Serine/threonine protein kinase n=1 Tax=Streptomyces davaonensis (strain DSM 101723 / JCM 4913 / KCC S-0913 / 768) TaxID=1214101 RepID=K4R5K2_STRDJ|nr:serine/threonine-protein kinase [Streptomyces davaonensis]CCK28382.1 serine/threonine protein kinase [Streptomyces davaonensis JCM 4913]